MSRQKSQRKGLTRAQIRQARRNRERIGRYIGFGVLGLIVLGAIWFFLIQPRLQSNQARAKSDLPPMTIDTSKQYFATVKMAKGGQFVIQLFPDKAPETVNSFVYLVNKGFYNGVTFHRVIPGFMAQGGDPEGTGYGGPGYTLPDEFNNGLTFDKAGVVAMANKSSPNSGGSQFFITFGPQPDLNGSFSIFGQVVSGMDVVNGLTPRDPAKNPNFTGDVIESITITNTLTGK